MPNLSIKKVPADVVGKLRERAARHHRSLQGELMELVTSAVGGSPTDRVDQEMRRTQRGHKSIEQIAAEHLVRVKHPTLGGGRSTDLVRADRDAR